MTNYNVYRNKDGQLLGSFKTFEDALLFKERYAHDGFLGEELFKAKDTINSGNKDNVTLNKSKPKTNKKRKRSEVYILVRYNYEADHKYESCKICEVFTSLENAKLRKHRLMTNNCLNAYYTYHIITKKIKDAKY